MKSNLYFLKNFNNYFNRIVKRLNTLSEYQEAVGQDGYFLLANTNFVPRDGISTFHTAGSSSSPFSYSWNPDYLIEVDDQDNIISRWYVIEFTRLMANQYRATLKRDTPADKLNPFIYSPAYIIKATLPDGDEMIVNSEKMMLNQIKTKEYFVKDKSHVPWIVCYFPQDRNSVITVDVKTDVAPQTDVPEISSDPIMSSLFLPGGQFITEAVESELEDQNIAITWGEIQHTFLQTRHWFYSVQNGRLQAIQKSSIEPKAIIDDILPIEDDERFASLLTYEYANPFEELKQAIQVNRSVKLNGTWPQPQRNKIWKHAGKYYKFLMSTEETYIDIVINMGEYTKELFRSVSSLPIQNDAQLGYSYATKKVYRCTLEPLQAGDARYEIVTNTKHCAEVPYDIIAFPLGETTIKNNGTDVANTIRQIALSAGRSLALKNSATASLCYDVQILPFCPYPEMLDDNGYIDVSKGQENVDYVYVRSNEPSNLGQILTIGLIPPSAYKTITINKLGTNLLTDEELNVSDVLKLTNRKEQNETDMWRLCSPNYASIFEFNLAKIVPIGQNSISYFDVNITYRPYSPYFRIAPQFGFLYGQNFEDARGLVANGQFSITLTDDKFLAYELQNKNYQAMFNREIASLEVNRNIQRERESWNITQAWTNMATGYLIGAGATAAADILGASPLATLGLAGATIGAGIRGGMNVATSYKERDWNERAYQEQREFKIDMFNMQLDNIKALPASITQSSAISVNFKFFPVLEYYTCTEKEKKAFRDKIKYNGMTVGRIAQILEFMSTEEQRYIQGQLIRIENLEEDSHLAQDLFEELNKGLFFEPYEITSKGVKLWTKKS